MLGGVQVVTVSRCGILVETYGAVNMRVCATGLLGVCCSYVCALEDKLSCKCVRRSKVGMKKEKRVKGVHGVGRGACCLNVWVFCARFGEKK